MARKEPANKIIAVKVVIGDHQLTYQGCQSTFNRKIKQMFVRNCGTRDIAKIEGISISTILSALTRSRKTIQPKQKHYGRLEIDEF